MDRSREELQSRAMAAGAVKYVWRDAQDEFVRHFVFPALMAGAQVPGRLPAGDGALAAADRAQMVDVARAEGATAVAHGCTGKGNDQVRFDVSVQALAPDLKIVAPLREWEMDRESEIEYAQEHNIPITRDEEEPVQHRREPLGPQHRDRPAGRPVDGAAGGRLAVDEVARTTRRTSPPTSRSASSSGVAGLARRQGDGAGRSWSQR